MSCRKRINSDANLNTYADTDTIIEYTHKKKKQMIYKSAIPHTTPHTTLHHTHTTPHHTYTTPSAGADGGAPQARDASFIPTASGIALYREEEVTALLNNQEQIFRTILEEKLREQFNMFNQMYIDF